MCMCYTAVIRKCLGELVTRKKPMTNTIYYTILYYTILYYTILYYTILYYTILLLLSVSKNNKDILIIHIIEITNSYAFALLIFMQMH